MKGLRPFFPYYGSKWRAALYYPEPSGIWIIEPFAGSACYSLRYPDRPVLLIEPDPVIYSIWKLLIDGNPSRVRTLPTVIDRPLSKFDLDPAEEALIGFWLNHGTTQPSKSPSAWMRAGKHKSSFWGPEIKQRIVEQLNHISHWNVLNTYYTQINTELFDRKSVTWFIDPPYQNAKGRHYKYNDIDYKKLGEWVMERKGQLIVCEQEGADWLPFKEFRTMKSTRGKSNEVIYTRG